MENLTKLYTNFFYELCKMNCYENAKHFYITYKDHIDIKKNNNEIYKYCRRNKYKELASMIHLIMYEEF